MPNIKSLTVVATFLSSFSIPAYGNYKKIEPKWFSCITNEDCIVGQGACREPKAFNKNFKDEAEAHFERISRTIRCAKSKKTETFKVRCINNKCVGDLKEL